MRHSRQGPIRGENGGGCGTGLSLLLQGPGNDDVPAAGAEGCVATKRQASAHDVVFGIRCGGLDNGPDAWAIDGRPEVCQRECAVWTRMCSVGRPGSGQKRTGSERTRENPEAVPVGAICPTAKAISVWMGMMPEIRSGRRSGLCPGDRGGDVNLYRGWSGLCGDISVDEEGDTLFRF